MAEHARGHYLALLAHHERGKDFRLLHTLLLWRRSWRIRSVQKRNEPVTQAYHFASLIAEQSHSGDVEMRPALLAALFCAAAQPALAAGKVFYGSRVGMTVTVRHVSGIGTDHARIEVEHTPADAKSCCVEYSNDRSAKCVRDTLAETHLSDEFRGNCTSGRFVTLYGDARRFMGENRRRTNDGLDPHYTIMLEIANRVGVSGPMVWR